MTNSVINGLPVVIGTSSHLYLCKQALATFASCLLSVSGGLTFGYTAVLLPQLKLDKKFPYDKEFDTWIASIAPLAMTFGCIFSGPMSDAIGRRKGQMLLIFPFTLGWLIMGIARNNTTMLAGRFITGLCTGAIRPLSMVYIGEVSDPKYRAITLFCPSVAIFVGSLISHTIGSYFHWRVVCFVFSIPNLICFLILLFLKESPLWMITNGQREKGAETFKWFRGNGVLAEKELNNVLENQNSESMSTLEQFTSVVLTKPFLKSIVIMFFLFLAVQMSGVNTITFYAQDIFKKTFGSDVNAFWLMIATDIIRGLCSVFMCVLARILPRRKTFLACCFGTTVVLVGLIVYLYINPEGLVWLAVTCLIAYITIASTLVTISWSFVAEIFPSKVRGLGSGFSSLLSFSLLFISVKVTPSILSNFGDVAMYGSFAIVTLISGTFLAFILPETNGKSLQEIENSFYNKNKNVPTVSQTICSKL